MTSPERLAAVDHILTTTRAVRKRFDLDRTVEPEVVLDCIRIAQQAPTGSNSQGWRFVVVTDAGLRDRLGELYREGAGDYFDRALEQARDDQARRVHESAAYLAANIQRVPVHVIPCVYGRPSEDPANAAGLFGSILPATWSLMLALRARGLGSVWTTLHLNRAKETAELLGIPDGVTQAGLVPVGYYTGTDFRPAARRPVEEITYWNGWKRSRAGGTS
ncbi:nitroreductase family protein [uncultured Jatrophihabitans sp.]|uniref:nitroreductase family protein n=1 Tax=uncultured Jatrophihabitans sp. TaxID=1610747 RepID=UPI0035CA022E